MAEKSEHRPHFAEGHGESALPEDKIEEALENLEEDWENDPENPRNWSQKKKWTAVSAVRLHANFLVVSDKSPLLRCRSTPSSLHLLAR